MKKVLYPLAFVVALTFIGLPASAMAEDATQQAFETFEQAVAPIQQQLYAKTTELDALLAGSQRDDAKVQQLFREIGELKGQIFIARQELYGKLGDSDSAYAYGRHHRGGMRGGYGSGGYGHGGGHMGRGGIGRGHHGGRW